MIEYLFKDKVKNTSFCIQYAIFNVVKFAVWWLEWELSWVTDFSKLFLEEMGWWKKQRITNLVKFNFSKRMTNTDQIVVLELIYFNKDKAWVILKMRKAMLIDFA